MTCYLCSDADITSEEVCEEIAQCAFDEACAFFSREDARRRGAPVGRKVHTWKPKSELTMRDRKAKLDEVKKKSTCRACGQKGHWAGDPACRSKPPKGVSKSGKGKGSKKQVQLKNTERRFGLIAISEPSVNPSLAGYPIIDDSNTDDDDNVVGYMAVRHTIGTPRPSEAPASDFSEDDGVLSTEDSLEEYDDEEMSDEADDRRARHAPPVTPQRGSGSAPRTPPRGTGGYPRDDPQRGRSGRGTGSAASSGPPEPIFTFGKFQGQLFGTATEMDPSYFFWAVTQRMPSTQLRNYVNWVEENFDVDYDIPELTRKSDKRTFTPPKEKILKMKKKEKKKSALATAAALNRKDKPPCRPFCDPNHCSRAGTNSWYLCMTCLRCGTVSKERRAAGPATCREAECQHENTDHRGSNRSVHKVFCLDCQTTVYEMPQEEYKKQQELLKQATLKG